MKAVRIHTYGGAEQLTYEEVVPPQEPGTGQVVVQVQAASVNPIDWKIREGWLKDFFPYEMPLILGTDMAGVVTAVGADVSTLEPGQSVYGLADMTLSGAYAEYAVGLASAIAPKPQSLDYLQAASVPVVAMTAWQALVEVGQVLAGQSILIHAAAGGVGGYAVQFAKQQGLYVVGTASAQNLDWVRDLGADEVLDYRQIPFEEKVRDLDMVLDTVGADTQTRSLDVLKPGGILVTTVSPPDQDLVIAKGVRAVMMAVEPTAAKLTEITALIDAGKIKLPPYLVLPLTEARQAHDISQGRHLRGKLVLQVVS